MIIMVGASASGKTELAKYLFTHYGYTKCITTTTRQKRMNEQDGVDYHFISEAAFQALFQSDAFVETTKYQQHLYGMQKKDVVKDGLVILDIPGANKVLSLMQEMVFVVYVYASEPVRLSRMLKRNDTLSSIEERIQSDALLFNADALTRMDLMIENEHDSIENLAAKIHKSYQAFMK